LTVAEERFGSSVCAQFGVQREQGSASHIAEHSMAMAITGDGNAIPTANNEVSHRHANLGQDIPKAER
tara:strand:- start:118 stop:321 length:204 start_codon:yes stop_codon:yes gene_type:complete